MIERPATDTGEHPFADRPEYVIVDARTLDLDEEALREHARELTRASRRQFVTRSYSYPFALVAWHDREIGADIEEIAPCDDAFAALICTPEERAEAAVTPDRDHYLTSLWSAKEALAKALGDALRYEPSLLDAPSRWSDGRAGTWRADTVTVDADRVAWICWRSAEGDASPSWSWPSPGIVHR